MGEQVGAGSLWGCSSVGRAPALQAGGQEFESLHLHWHGEPCMYLENRIQKTKTEKNLKQEIDIREAVKNSQKKEEPKTGDVTLYIRAEGTRKKSPKPEPVKQERAQGGCLGTESR